MNSEEQHSASTDVTILGTTIAGLVVARDLARRGYRVTVIDSADAPGGSARSLALDGAAVSTRPEGFIDDTGATLALTDELGLRLTTIGTAAEAIRLSGRTVPMPQDTVLGIPGAPLARDVIDVLGWGGAMRAYSDRLRPVLKIGRYSELGALVRGRMGGAVIDRMLEPVTRAVFGSSPGQLALADALPELNGAITRSGSLSGAIVMLRADFDSDEKFAVRDVEGGLHRLVEALVDDAVDYHADLKLSTAIDLASRDEEGWLLTLTSGEQLRTQAVVNARTEINPLVRVSMLVPATILEGVPYSRVFVAPAEQQVRATDVQISDHAPGQKLLTLSYRESDEGGDALAEQAVRDAETILSIRIGTPASISQTAHIAMPPAFPDGDGVHTVPASYSLSHTVRSAHEIAASIKREDFAVEGVSWTVQVIEASEDVAEHDAEAKNEETA